MRAKGPAARTRPVLLVPGGSENEVSGSLNNNRGKRSPAGGLFLLREGTRVARRESIIHQVLSRIDELKRFGQSKHEAKQAEKERCRAAGEKWNPARVPGIFSHKTCDVYKEHCLNFARWARETYGCRTLEQAREHVGEWLMRPRERDGGPRSAWTVRVEAAALAKLYRCRSTDFGVELPRRSREDIHRSRVAREHDRHFSEAKNRDAVDFCRATGLRRKELIEARWRDVYRGEDGRLYVHVERGKGGRSREVPVLERYRERVWELRERARAEGRDRLFERVPNRADIHGYRREYASERYRELERERRREEPEREREVYRRRDGREFDREILRQVSRDLGHNREDVIARHYLD